MTTGERLVTLSGLPGVETAMTHYLAIDTSGGGGPGGTTIIDAFTAELSGDIMVEIEDEMVTVTLDTEFDSEVDGDNIDGTVSGDIDVEVDCS